LHWQDVNQSWVSELGINVIQALKILFLLGFQIKTEKLL